jgi:phospholipid/cholesterol/gamma-HCH transport system permease protein
MAEARRAQPSLGSTERDSTVVLRPQGVWTIDHANDLALMCERAELPNSGAVCMDFAEVEALDSAAVAVIRRLQQRIEAAGLAFTTGAMPERQKLLFGFLDEKYRELQAPLEEDDDDQPAEPPLAANLLAPVLQARDFIGFIGLTVISAVRAARHPKRFPLGALLHHMQEAWVSALPIIGFLSFVIGLTMVLQSQAKLQEFGAEIQVIGVVGDTMLRAVGFLLAALILAGRSGSAFAAQLGAMNAAREIDAMRTTGLDPIEILVIPRILALLITFPFLGFFAAIVGIVGGGIAAWIFIDVPPAMFINTMRADVGLEALLMGLLQAPFFAVLVGLVGCFQGLRADKGTRQVGQFTTLAVVQCLFLVLFTGALFQMFYQFLDLV